MLNTLFYIKHFYVKVVIPWSMNYVEYVLIRPALKNNNLLLEYWLMKYFDICIPQRFLIHIFITLTLQFFFHI
jgi:hypothetical protein